MTKKYDVIVVGAGPAGLLAARAAGENGFAVALLEKKADLTAMNRACGQTLDHPFGYLHRDIYRLNTRDKRIGFPAHGFSVKYDGPFRKSYAIQNYSPGGHKVQIGLPDEQKKKGDYGVRTVVCDKEILFRCLLDEVEACGVEVFPGINVEKVTPTSNGVSAEGSGQTFEGRYLIAADGVNSRIAELMGFNKDRSYYGNLNSLQYNMYGMEVPNDDSHYHVFGFPKGGPAQLFIFPKPGEKEHIAIVATMHPEVNLKEAWKYFTRELFCASWFRNARQLRSFSAVITCRSPIAEPYKDRILLTGDVPATLEVEITGALIWGWQAGNAISLALQEENLGMEPTAISRYINRWQEDHIKHTNHEAIMRNFGLPYALYEPGDMDYVWSLSKAPLPAPPGNTYDEIAWERGPFVEHMKLIMPIIRKERPELIPLILRAGLPCTELYAEIIKISKPIA